MLATFYGETDHFRDPRILLEVVMRDGINGSGILAAVGIAKAYFSSAAASESRQKATDHFKQVPSHGRFVKRHDD